MTDFDVWYATVQDAHPQDPRGLAEASWRAAKAVTPPDWLVREINVVWYDGTGEDFATLSAFLDKAEEIAARRTLPETKA